MKKLVIAAVAVVTLTAFAADISTGIMNLFNTPYPGAGKMHYKTVRELASIDFLLHGTHMQAFYSNDGEPTGTSDIICYKSLPRSLQAMLDSRFKDYTATEVIEMKPGTAGTLYYVWLVKGHEKVIAQISTNGEVSLFKQSAE